MKRRKPRIDREFPADVKADVAERAGFRCEVCNVRPLQHYHHRLTRSAGGLGTIENCLGVCAGPPDGGCHARIHNNPAWAYEQGYLIRRAS